MRLRVLVLGGLPDDVRTGIARAGQRSWEIALVDFGRSGRPEGLDTIARAEPDLIVVGEGAAWSCLDLASAFAEPKSILPTLTTTDDPDADFSLVGSPVALDRTLQSALRLASLRHLARTGSTTPAEGPVGLHRLDVEFARALRYRHSLSLVVLALDDSDEITRLYGEAVLAEFMGSLEESLVRSLRATDFLFRMGEQDIAVVLPETPSSGACVVAQRLRTRARAIVFKGEADVGRPALPFKVTASVGVAEGPAEGVHSALELLERARGAIRGARVSGGDRVVVS